MGIQGALNYGAPFDLLSPGSRVRWVVDAVLALGVNRGSHAHWDAPSGLHRNAGLVPRRK